METVEDRILYLWHRVFLHRDDIVEVEAAAICTETLLSCPYCAGTRLL
jgi:hypothetical protein